MINNGQAKISIIMGTYNEERFIARGIESIISQSYENWELIIDDCSTDNTIRILQEYAHLDSRIIYVHHNERVSFAQSLNNGISIAKGDYIARMDPDDISLPNRLQTELSFLEEHPEFGFVSCATIVFDDEKDRYISKPKEYPSKENFLWGTQFSHPGTMFRTEILKECGGYLTNTGLNRVPEDYELFMRLYSMGYKGYNITEPLLKYYESTDAVKRKRKYRHRLDEAKIRYYGFKSLGLLPKGIPYVVKPLLVGLIPHSLILKIHDRQMKS